MNFRLILAALLLVGAVGSWPCAAEDSANAASEQQAEAETERPAGNTETARTPGKKFKKTAFPRDKFSILLPPDYYAAQKGDKGCNTYTASDYPHGLLMAMCLTAPEHTTFSPVVMKELFQKLTASKKSLDKESQVSVNGQSGTQWDVTNSGDTPQNGCRVRGFIAGRKMYILMAHGTKPWLDSEGIKQFMDSLEVTQ